MQGLLNWASAIPILIGFALSMGAHPATYGATTDMLARRTEWFPRLCWMACGLIVGSTLLFTLFQFVNPDSFVDRVVAGLKHTLTDHTADRIIALLLFLAGVGVVVWKLKRPKLQVSTPKEVAPQARLGVYFVIGISSSIVGFTTLPVMYLTGRIVSTISPHLAPRIIAYAIFLVFLIAPFFVMAIIWKRMPVLAAKVEKLYRRILHWDYRWLLAAFFAAAAIAAFGFSLYVPHR